MAFQMNHIDLSLCEKQLQRQESIGMQAYLPTYVKVK